MLQLQQLRAQYAAALEGITLRRNRLQAELPALEGEAYRGVVCRLRALCEEQEELWFVLCELDKSQRRMPPPGRGTGVVRE